MISINNVSKKFKSIKAVNQLHLEVKQGEFLALLGPNGAGKTTLIEMIEGLKTPSSGNIEIKGMNWKNHTHELRSIMGIALQETRFIDKITVKETLNLFCSFYNINYQRTQEVLEAVQLEDKQHTFTVNLSGGQRQRLALGVALLHNPEILLLDEPTTGLDPHTRREIWEILNQLKHDYNTTLILTTHYMEEAEYLCDRIVIMDKGKILAKGTLQELLNQYSQGEHITIELGNEPESLSGLEKLPDVLNQFYNKGKIRLTVRSITHTLPELLSLLNGTGQNIKSIECRKETLDDLFINMTGRNLND